MYLRCLFHAHLSTAARGCPALWAADSELRSGLCRFAHAKFRPVLRTTSTHSRRCCELREESTLTNTSRTCTRYGSCTRPSAHHITCWRDPIGRVQGRGCHPPPTARSPPIWCVEHCRRRKLLYSYTAPEGPLNIASTQTCGCGHVWA